MDPVPYSTLYKMDPVPCSALYKMDPDPGREHFLEIYWIFKQIKLNSNFSKEMFSKIMFLEKNNNLISRIYCF